MSENKTNVQLTGQEITENKIDILESRSKIRETTSRRQRRRKAREKYALPGAQTSSNADNSQSQPPNVYPEAPVNTWTPNFQPMVTQNIPQAPWPQPQDPWSQPQGPWSQPQEPWSQPQVPWPQPQEPWSQPQGPGSQPLDPWSQPQDPWAQPQANTPNDIFNFGPTNIVGNCFPQNNMEHIQQPLLNGNNNMGIQTFPHPSKQPKKIKKKIVQQRPKKLKSAELSFEEKQKREAELRLIAQKYRQAVMIQKSLSQKRTVTPVVPNKPKAKVTPTKQQAPVGIVAPSQIKAPEVSNKLNAEVTPSKTQAVGKNVSPEIKTIGNTIITPIPPGQSLQPPATDLTTTKPKRRQRSRKNKKNQNYPSYTPQVQASPGTSQYQAPHQDEPEDLTDDLAPNMAGGQQQPGAQPRAVTVENKLNFKFQRSVSKNPDWSEYQNKFRRIGGGSPEPGAEPEGVVQVKQEPNQSINTESNAKAPIQSQSATGPQLTSRQQQNAGSSNAGRPPAATPTPTPTPQKPPATPKIEPAQKPASQKQPQLHRHPMEMKNQQKNQKFMSVVYNPFDNYPKGIPKSFLQHDPQSAANPQIPQPYAAGIPKSFLQQATQAPQSNVKGIPKSFLQQASQIPQTNPATNYAKEVHYQARDEQPSPHIDLPSWILASQAQPEPEPDASANAPMFPTMFVHQEATDRPYSPTDVYSETPREEPHEEGSESPDTLQSNQKRQSAFSRLGPLSQPKKPKLTINLMLNKEQAVREVVDETDSAYRFVPVHLRKDILESSDEVVKKYLPFWPWKRNLMLRKTVSARHSKSVMILEQEQMESGYEKNNLFIQVSVKGYPKTWNKEDVLDAILECVKGKHFIPCFIEFTAQECKFLVIRCKDALTAIHKLGFCVRASDAELIVSISLTDTSLNQIDLIPRLVLRKRLMTVYDAENTLNLTEFFAEKDVSHFVYFPLNRHTNQLELVQLQSAVAWEYLTELNLSQNRLTSISGFDLCKTTPRLKRLDLSRNHLERLPALLPLRELPLRALRLEGNPLCHDYVDAAHYVKVVRMMFSEVRELDGVRITLRGELPPARRNHCPAAAVPLVDKFLETFFPLLEAYEERAAIEDLYDKDAVLTITFRYKLRYGTAYRYFRNLFMRSRSLEEGELESIEGAGAIAALLHKWPPLEHDRYSMTVDVLHHDDQTTILRVGGILKLTAETLAEDEHLLTFARTVVLHTRTGAEYKIHNEMLSWDVAREEVVRDAFNVTTVRPKQLSLKLESPPDEDLKSKLVDIFVKLADIDKKRGARCLELKSWDLRSALEYYISLLKLDDLSPLSPPKESTPAPQAS